MGVKLPPGPGEIKAADYVVNPLGLLMGLAQRYGEMAHFTIAGQLYFLVNHPDYVKEVLLTKAKDYVKTGLQGTELIFGNGLIVSEGDFHRRQRKLMQPALHRERVAEYSRVMVDCATEVSQSWKPDQVLDLAEEMMALTLIIVARTLLGADLKEEAREIGKAVADSLHGYEAMRNPTPEALSRAGEILASLQKSRATLDAVIYKTIARRKRSGPGSDLLSRLLVSEDEEGNRMTEAQVRDEAMSIFLAGHETTANALTWTWYLLSGHPEAEKKLHAELDKALGGRIPGAADLEKLPYAGMVFSEALRLYPPIWGMSRKAVSTTAIGPYEVPAGSTVFLCPYVSHRNPNYFPEPGAFVPERFVPEAGDARPKFAYFPFGAGSRMCIGEGFAWMEGILILASLGQRWRLELLPGHPVEAEPLVSLRPKHGMKMIARSRKKAGHG